MDTMEKWVAEWHDLSHLLLRGGQLVKEPEGQAESMVPLNGMTQMRPTRILWAAILLWESSGINNGVCRGNLLPPKFTFTPPPTLIDLDNFKIACKTDDRMICLPKVSSYGMVS